MTDEEKNDHQRIETKLDRILDPDEGMVTQKQFSKHKERLRRTELKVAGICALLSVYALALGYALVKVVDLLGKT